MWKLILLSLHNQQEESTFFEECRRVCGRCMALDDPLFDQYLSTPKRLEGDLFQILENDVLVRRSRFGLFLEPLPYKVRHILVDSKHACPLPWILDGRTMFSRQGAKNVSCHRSVRGLPHASILFQRTNESRSFVLLEFSVHVVSQLLVVESAALELAIDSCSYLLEIVRSRQYQQLAQTILCRTNKLSCVVASFIQPVEHQQSCGRIEVAFDLSQEI